MIVYVVGACGLILGTILGAALMQWRFDQHVQERAKSKSLGIGTPVSNEYVEAVMAKAKIAEIEMPEIHKLEMGDGEIRYQVKDVYVVDGQTWRHTLSDRISGKNHFETEMEAQSVADRYYQKKLSETVIKDTVV